MTLAMSTPTHLEQRHDDDDDDLVDDELMGKEGKF
jgi:hypothetical protein